MNNTSSSQLRSNNSGLGLSFGSDASLRSIIASATPEERIDLPTRRKTSVLRGPVFVVGCPRSGTTVLGKCLSSHSKLAGAEESLFLLDIWRIILDLHQGQNARSWGPLNGYLSLQQLIEASGNFADCIFGGLVAQLNKTHLIEHTPWYVALLPLLRSLYPDCRVLHLLRDGRDVVASLSTSFEKGFAWAGESIAERTQLWKLLVSVGQRDANTFPSDQYREWKYEQLCESPRQTMHEILDWLGLSFEESALQPLAVQHAGPSRSGATLAAVDESGRLEIQSRVVGGKWPIHWTNEDRGVFADIGDELLTKLNYTVLPATKQIDNKQ